MISFMFKALMVLTFGVISNKVCYTLVCFYMHFFLWFYNAPVCWRLFKYKEEEMKDHLLASDGKKTMKSSTVQYARLLDFFTKKIKLCSWLQLKGVPDHTFVADFFFLFFLKWCSILRKQTKKLFWSNLCTLHLP